MLLDISISKQIGNLIASKKWAAAKKRVDSYLEKGKVSDVGAATLLSDIYEDQREYHMAHQFAQDAFLQAKNAGCDRYDLGFLRMRLAFISRLIDDDEQAKALYEECLLENPTGAKEQYNVSLFQLMSNDLTRGFKGYTQRFLHDKPIKLLGGFPYSRYNLVSINKSSNLVLIGEQGIGDQLFFLRYVPLLTRHHEKKRLFIVVDPRLVALFKSSVEKVNFVSIEMLNRLSIKKSETSVIALGDLPALLVDKGMHFDGANSYPAPIKQWLLKRVFADKSMPGIGVSWGSPAGNRGDKKSIDAAQFFDLLPVDVTKISLQYGIEPSDKSEDSPHPDLVWPNLDLKDDLVGVSTLISSLTCVVSVSTVVVHLAGLLGVPTLLLVPSSGLGRLWYWHHLNGAGCSCWYPCVQIVCFDDPELRVKIRDFIGKHCRNPSRDRKG